MPSPPVNPDRQPIIVLVEPQLGENIGMCARAMLNCGLDRLRLVKPRDGWPSPKAKATAADADRVIEQVECFDSVADAVADRQRVLATTARRRRLQIPVREVGAAISEIRNQDPMPLTAILFGGEASGLDNDALVHADQLISFATNPEFSSLNLAQAVLLLAWEWRRSSDEVGRGKGSPGEGTDFPARRADLEVFLGRLEESLDEAAFFLTPQLRPDTVRNLRALFTRTNPSEDELRMLHGVLSALTREKQEGNSPVPD